MAANYDALLVVSFGGPEGPDDVRPFLANVLRGRNVPPARLEEVEAHYAHFGGVSPLNAQNRALIAALGTLLAAEGPQLPIYWGNRNWRPFLAEALAQMARDGVRRVLAFFTSAYSSYSGCRQYREDIERAKEEAGVTGLQVDKLRVFFNHPGFIGPMIERVRQALATVPADRQADAPVIYTAHSIPTAMADRCAYAAQLQEAAGLVSAALGVRNFQLAYQSRSGPPQQPWLAPDICDALRALAADGASRDVVVAPIGFLSDHLEILWDLDVEAREVASQLGLSMVRAGTVGDHPEFVRMIRELILERTSDAPRRALGSLGPSHDVCPAECCLYAPAGRPT